MLKDVTHYARLFSRPGPLLLDLGNGLDKSVNLDGEFDGGRSLFQYVYHYHHLMRSTCSDALCDVLLWQQGNSTETPRRYPSSVDSKLGAGQLLLYRRRRASRTYPCRHSLGKRTKEEEVAELC